MASDRSPVRLRVKLLSPEARIRRKLSGYREELSRLREEGGLAWAIRWYEVRIRQLEEELASLSSSFSSPSPSGSPSKPQGKS